MKRFSKQFTNLYIEHRPPMSSAALSYYLTMTFFPVLICLYYLLGSNLDKIREVMDFISAVFPGDTVNFINGFLDRISTSSSPKLLFFAISVVLISASAGFRNIQNSIGRMQGGMRYYGYAYFLYSIFLSIVFVFLIYICIAIMFFSKSIINFINKLITWIEIDHYWLYLKFLILLALIFIVLVLIYNICKRKEDHYKTIVGAFISTNLMVVVCYIFSKILNIAIKYPLIYGSLASLILLMFWLYCMSLCLYLGALINITLRDLKEKKSDP